MCAARWAVEVKKPFWVLLPSSPQWGHGLKVGAVVLWLQVGVQVMVIGVVQGVVVVACRGFGVKWTC